MVRKWIQHSLMVVFVLSLAFVLKSVPRETVRAQAITPRAYFPMVFKSEPTRFDDFQDDYPEWDIDQQEARDGDFFYRSGRAVWTVTDNSANNIAFPPWRPLGDFKVEMDARFVTGEWMNGLGLVFCGNDDWQEYYIFVMGYNFNQHHWNVARADPNPSDPNNPRYDWLGDWDGVPGFVNPYDNWNHLAVVRVGNQFSVYANGRQLGSTVTDGTYGTNRLVGILATAYEWGSKGDHEYDNFTLTPLSDPY